MADELCEVIIENDLLEYVHVQTGGNIGRIVIGINKIENFALANGLGSIDATQWAGQNLYFDQPTFRKSKIKPQFEEGEIRERDDAGDPITQKI